MILYPNYNSLNNFFIENFTDYTKFINELDNLTFNDTIKVFDRIQDKYTELNDTYNSKQFIIFENFIVDSYLNSFDISENQLDIQNYIQFPPYILFLIKEKITEKPTIDDINNKKALLKLTKYVIIHNNQNDNDDNDEDIEDTIYLKNKLSEYKFKLNETEHIISKKEDKINELNKIITELKLKLRKANFSLMENQNIFSELHVDMCEKEEELKKQNKEIKTQQEEINTQQEDIKKQNEEIKKQQEEIKKQNEEIYNYESSFIYKIYTIYEGFYIFFSRFHF